MTVERVDPPLAADERAMLDAWLDYHRDTLALKCDGLSGGQLRERAVPPSNLSLLGLVRHMAEVERQWFTMVLGGEQVVADERRRADDREVLRLLVDAGADIRVRGRYGDTLLHLAAARDRDDLAALLIERGAEIDALDDSTWTPLHMAADRRSIAVAKGV